MSTQIRTALHEAVTQLLAAIDAGDVVPDETEMVALALAIKDEGGPGAFELCCELAARCECGRKALKDIAQ